MKTVFLGSINCSWSSYHYKSSSSTALPRQLPWGEMLGSWDSLRRYPGEWIAVFWEITLFTTIDTENQKHLWQPQLLYFGHRTFYKRVIMGSDSYSHKNCKCCMGSQETTYFTFLSWKSSNDGDAMVSLGSLIALQCFTIYIMSNLSTLGVWTHDFLSSPEHSWRTDCFFTSFIRLWKILPYKNLKNHTIF